MENLYCNSSDLNTESDVEQKFIYKFLTSENPTGLNFSDSDINTKKIIKAYNLNKGQNQKTYVPDYLIIMSGLPLLVVEAKKPNENMDEAFAEARLYASEINSTFKHGQNICKKVICSNGQITYYGYNDQNMPIDKLSFNDFAIGNSKFHKFIDFCSKESFKDVITKFYIKIRGQAIYKSPISELGKVQNEELEENSYGRTLVFENHNLLDPDTEKDRALIVKNAYVKSSKREQHIEPIYKELRKMMSYLDSSSILIDSDRPFELVEKLKETSLQSDNIINSLMLLIGNAGCGKSTFIRYFKEVILNNNYPNVAKNFIWAYINLNTAPINSNEIYDWIKNEIINKIYEIYENINFNDLKIIKQIFKQEINDFEIGLGSLLRNDENKYNEELYILLKEKNNDKSLYLQNLLQYIIKNKLQIPVIVLDNCDKRNETEQLLMFEVAQWLRETFKCIVFLPMRNTTYEKYKQVPPIDTVVKDLIFRIDPADLLKVLQARLDYISRISSNTSDKYSLQNGLKVLIQKKEQIEYFKAILMMIRDNRWAKTIFYNLSNGNIREAIQLFEDFCKSGHINSEDIFSIKATDGKYHVPSYKLLNALIRKNRKYYNEAQSNFTNLFYADNNDKLPDPFVRIDILLFLKANRNEIGISGQKGYVKISNVINILQRIGHNSEIVFREIKNLILKKLINSDSVELDENSLIIITSSGFLHINLLSNISYLAACAENIIYRNNEIMVEIAQRLVDNNYLDKINLYKNVNTMYNYLKDYRKNFIIDSSTFLKEECCIEVYNLEHVKNALDKIVSENPYIEKNLTLEKDYPIGKEVQCVVKIKYPHGYICEIDNKHIKGFIPLNNNNSSNLKDICVNEKLKCQIVDFNTIHKSFTLQFIENLKLDL